MITNDITRPQILVGDGGSQYTLKIASSYREAGYRVAVLPLEKTARWLAQNIVKAIVISGGPSSVNDKDAPKIPKEILDSAAPKLMICYGMQATAKQLGGKVQSIEGQRGYGPERLKLDTSCALFADIKPMQLVWASHGDSVKRVPKGFRVIARNHATGGIAGMVGKAKNGSTIWCVQFHPEVHHTSCGKAILRNFASLAELEKDWRPIRIVENLQETMLAAAGKRIVLIGMSGGVDSTTLGRIASPVFGKRLHGVLIDGGQLQEGEVEEIKRHSKAAGVRLIVVDAKMRFAKAFGDTIDAEKVRAIFRKLYVEILLEVAWFLTNGRLEDALLLQGTLAPDLIESGATGGALIKTHHNVNLDTGDLAQLHPFGNLFKYDVRALARKLGLPKSVSERHPSPGPCNFIRLPNLPKTPGNLAIVAWCYARTKEVLEKHGYMSKISQLVVTYDGVKKVGIKGDGRVYEPVPTIRAIRSIDYMTAYGVYFPEAIYRDIEAVLTRHPKITRVQIDPTHKPPGTTEAE